MSYRGKTIDLSKFEQYGKTVELAKIEVELGALQDLESKAKSLVPLFQKLDKVSEEVSDAKILYSKLLDQSNKIVAELRGEARVITSDLQKLKTKAKELGVNLETKVIDKILEDLEKGIKAIISF
jgi:predicted  nucleic acid-binding Zn-ribbon protein